jgi:hypothetical protein
MRTFIGVRKAGLALVALGLVLPALHTAAPRQNGRTFSLRLAPAPALGLRADAVHGEGAGVVTIDGNRLTIAAAFSNLASPATTASLFLGKMTAVMGGERVGDLTVTREGNGTRGTITGTVELNAERVAALGDGRFYVQLNSEGTAESQDGHLQGWLLP